MNADIITQVFGTDHVNTRVIVDPGHRPHLGKYAEALKSFKFESPVLLGSGEDSIAIAFQTRKGNTRVLKVTLMTEDEWNDDWGDPEVYDYLCPIIGEVTHNRIGGVCFVSYVQPLVEEVEYDEAIKFADWLLDECGVHLWDAAGDKILEQLGRWHGRVVLHDYRAVFEAA
ncbi:hypothetical protein BH10CYA1_BH10CYA1_17960 [soil metagenome]